MLKLKNSSLYNQDMYFKEDSIEIKYKKELKQQFKYCDILQFDIYVNIDKFYAPQGSIANLFCDFACTHSVNLTIDIKTKDFDKYTFIFICQLKQVFDLIKYKNFIQNFNLYLIEENTVKSFVKIPLILYAISGTKFNILGKPFSRIELASLLFILIPFLICFLPAYFSKQLDISTVFIILPLFIISICLSLVGIYNEIRKLKLRKQITSDMITPSIEKINEFGEKQNLLIDNNKIIFSEDCYRYLNSFRYVSIISFIINSIIIFNALRIANIL